MFMRKRVWIVAAACLLLAFSAGCQQEKENPAVSGDYTGDVVAQEDFPEPKQNTDDKIGYQLDLPEEGEEIAVMETNLGTMKFRFFPEAAPKAVYNFKCLAETGYYDGLTFHRVVQDFIIQSGDPNADSTGGESIWGEPFADEFNSNLLNLYGSVSMANSGVDTNGSQFFIVPANTVPEPRELVYAQYGQQEVAQEKYNEVGGAPWLDGSYTVFGQVFEGMDVVDAIVAQAKDTDENGIVAEDQRAIIESITVAPATDYFNYD